MEAHQQSATLAAFGDGPFFVWLRKALRHNVLDVARHPITQKKEACRRVRASGQADSMIRLEELLVSELNTHENQSRLRT